MFTKTKLALAGALVFGVSSVALARDEAPDSVHYYGPATYQALARQEIEARGAFIPQGQVWAPQSPTSIEQNWFDRESNTPAG